ncbi:MAG: FAD:protein FMN transferase [Elusimicrobiota bacterium]|nr:FAD:protein FMN transferase [Elusimicrobiota bacterium]
MKSNINKKPALALALLLAAPAARPSPQERRPDRARFVMGTVCELEAEGPDAAVTAAFEELERWDRVLSLYKADSELVALNAKAGSGPVPVSAALFAAVAEALRRAEETGGAFDPTVLPLLRRGPAARGAVGWKKVTLDAAARTVSLPAGGGLDFGAIGKGWALDRAAEVLAARGVTAARFNFGGQVLAVGAPAGAAGWEVTIPGRAEPLLLKDASVAVTGDSERPGHVVSPFSGRRLRRDFAVAVLAPSAAEADAWSTALFVLGKNPPSFRGRSFFSPGIPARKRLIKEHAS